jgi:hypothetical protein
MTHPGPLLADYVDGSLGDADRAAVQRHLATCPTCRREVALARAARSSLRSLPAAAPPLGLADAAIAEATAGTPPTDIAEARKARPVGRWIAAAAGVAAVLVAIAVISPGLGSSPSRTAADGAASGGAARSFPKASDVEVVRANLSEAQLASVAASLGGAQPQQPEASPAMGVSSADTVAPDLQAAAHLPDRLPAASACLATAWGDTPGLLTRVLLTRFEGTPAYVGLYAVGPGAGLPPTRLQLLVASIHGCQPLASSYALL